MSWPLLTLLAAVLPLVCEGLRGARRQQASDLAAARRAEWAAVYQAESDDRRFWAAEWAALETELLRLQDAAAVASPKNATNATSVQKVTKNATNAKSVAGHTAPPAKAAGPPSFKLNMKPTSAADLVPALAMLKGLYEDGKSRIAALNAREKTSKQHFADKEAEHNTRIARIESRFANHTLSAEFRTNETKDENRLWSYWQRVRERQHHQFHTSLKIQHGTMEKVKKMIEMYEQAISGKADKAQMKQELRQVGGGLPEIVFLQDEQQAVVRYCHEALTEVRAARAAEQQQQQQSDIA